ncbi:AAA family ATPase [Paenibacillus sp. GD4]|uniref:AAA family ATPase n=1 Tax=Paenibacillus sp. GD4 TaxID=3068890 RepID=UPI002796B37B|nr:AAA family ATPase [Paenibacillus sp. GD4]MDQ1909741.1 AAA family ATPase [Paenibacillus sp. GD4]
MKIERMEIQGFGALRERELRTDSQVTLIYGRNEAGKSTLTGFIRAMLFGFPARGSATRYTPSFGGMHGGALALVDEEGQRIRVERWDGASGGGRGRGPASGTVRVIYEDGRIGGERELAELVRGMSAELYRSLFAFGLTELQELRTLHSDEVSAYLYSAGLGVGSSSIRQAEKKLASELEQLYKPRGRMPAMNRSLEGLEQAQRELRQSMSLSEQYDRLREAASQLEEQIVRSEAELCLKQHELDWLKKCLKARPLWLRLRDAEEELAGLKAVTELPEDAVRRMESLQGELAQLTAEQDKLQRLAAEKTRLMEELETERDGTMLAELPRLEALLEERPVYEETKRQLAEAEAELRVGEQELECLLRLVSPEWQEADAASLDSFVLLREQALELREAQRAWQQEERQLQRDQERLQDELELRGDASGSDSDEAADWEQLLHQVRSVRRRYHQWKEAQLELRYAEEAGGIEAGLSGSSRAVVYVLAMAVPAAVAFVGEPGLAAALLVLLLGGSLLLTRRRHRAGGPPRLAELRARLEPLEAQRRELAQAGRGVPGEQARRAEAAGAPFGAAAWAPRGRREPRDSAGWPRRPSASSRGSTRWRRTARRRRGRTPAAAPPPSGSPSCARARRRWPCAASGTPAPAPRWRSAAAAWSRGRGGRLRRPAPRRRRSRCGWRSRRAAAAAAAPPSAGAPGRGASRPRASRRPWRRLGADARGGPGVARGSAGRPCGRQLELRRRSEEAALERAAALEQLALLEAQQARVAARLAELFAEAGADGEEALRHAERQTKRREQLQAERRQTLLAIRAWFTDEQLSRLEEEMAVSDEAELQRRGGEAAEEASRLSQRLEELRELRGRRKYEMERLEDGADHADKLQRVEERRSELMEQVKRYAVHAMSAALISKAKRLYEQDKQPSVMQRASGYFERMTGGRFTRIVAPLGEQTVLAERAGGALVETARLSRGTAEQMYLCIRLALADEYAASGLKLPLVMDDIFVNFDEERLEHSLRLLQELAERHQLLLFTCHEHVRDRFVRFFPRETVIEL